MSNNKIEGYLCIYENIETGETVEVVHHKDHIVYSRIADSKGYAKKASDAQVGEVFEGLLNFINASLDDLEGILNESYSYRTAKSAISIVNSSGKGIPQTRYFLIKGMIEKEELKDKINTDNLEKKLLLEDRFDFTPEEYDKMAEFLHPLLEKWCSEKSEACVTKETVKNGYIRGSSVFPRQWAYFNFFKEINGAFNEYADSFWFEIEGKERIKHTKPDSKAFFYDVYIGKRLKLKKRLEKICEEIKKDIYTQNNVSDEEKGKAIKEVLKRHYEVPDDITPELRLIFERFDGKESQYAPLRLKKKEELTKQEYKREKNKDMNKRKNISVVVNATPKYPSWKETSTAELHNACTFLSKIFRYSLLKFYSGLFDERSLSHYWCMDLDALVQFQEGIKTAYTSFITKSITNPEQQSSEQDVKFHLRNEKRRQLIDVANKARYDISLGRFEEKFGLNPGEYQQFFTVYKRVLNALPGKYWELQRTNYELHNGKQMSIVLEVIPGESRDQAIARHTTARNIQLLAGVERINTLQAELGNYKRTVFGDNGDVEMHMPWVFILEPSTLNMPFDKMETMDMLRCIEDPKYIPAILKHAVQMKEYKDTMYSYEKAKHVLDNFGISAVMKLVHPNNFIGPGKEGIDEMVLPTREIYRKVN